MRLNDIVDIAQNTDLKQIVVGEDTNQVIALLNLALIEVYGSLTLIQEEQIIPIHKGQTRYLVQENTQRVLQALDQDGVELPINDDNDDTSIFMPTPFEIHVTEPNMPPPQVVPPLPPHFSYPEGTPYKNKLTRISLIISTTPPFVTKANINTLNLIVPEALLESILSYMAYRAYLSMNGDQQSEAASHFQRYKMAMTDLLKKGFVGQSIMTNLKGTNNGFV